MEELKDIVIEALKKAIEDKSVHLISALTTLLHSIIYAPISKEEKRQINKDA